MTNISRILILTILLITNLLAQTDDISKLHFQSKSNLDEIELDLNIQSNIQENFDTPGIWERENLSGDWGGVRNSISDIGFDFEFNYKTDFLSNIYGGTKKGNTFLDNFDFILLADLKKSLGFDGTIFKFHLLRNSGGQPCELVGASQGLSNIETTPTWKIYQLLIEKYLFNKSFSILAGLYDLNSEFDVRESSSIFLNPSHGIGDDFAKSGLNGPSIFPTTSLAIRLKYEFENDNFIQAAILDGVPGNPENPFGTHIILNKKDGVLLTSEVGIVKKNESKKDFKIALGAWFYTSALESYSINTNREAIANLKNNFGFYLSSEKNLYTHSTLDYRELVGFIRIGYANKYVNPTDFYFGTGFTFSGLFNNKENDKVGIAVAIAHNSGHFVNAMFNIESVPMRSYEINLEATYLFELTPWLKIQPNIQYIINPTYCFDNQSALAIGSRIEIVF